MSRPRKPTAEMFADDVPEVVKEVGLPSASHNITTLPSNGVFGYPAEVEYRDILVKDEEVLSGATVETYSKTLNAVIKSLMNDCPFYENLIIHDRDYMLLWIWANNYTSSKNVEIACVHCDNKDHHKVDFTKLETVDVKKTIKIPFEIPLQKGGKIVVRMNTVADELFAEEYVKKNKNVKFEQVMMVRSIDVGSEIPFNAKMKWVSENLRSKEMGIVRQFHKHFAFGIPTSIEHTCSACGGVTRGDLPFQTEDILYPTVQSDFEKLL
jgi:hypothetical protein